MAADWVCLVYMFTLLPLNVQYYSPDELNRRYEKTSSIGSKRVVSRTGRNNVIYLHNYEFFSSAQSMLKTQITTSTFLQTKQNQNKSKNFKLKKCFAEKITAFSNERYNFC